MRRNAVQQELGVSRRRELPAVSARRNDASGADKRRHHAHGVHLRAVREHAGVAVSGMEPRCYTAGQGDGVSPLSDNELNAAAVELADWMMARVQDGTVDLDALKRRFGFPGQLAQLIDKAVLDHRLRHPDDAPPDGVYDIRLQLGRQLGSDRVLRAVTGAFYQRHRRALAQLSE